MAMAAGAGGHGGLRGCVARSALSPSLLRFLQLLADGPFLFVRLFPTSGALRSAAAAGRTRPDMAVDDSALPSGPLVSNEICFLTLQESCNAMRPLDHFFYESRSHDFDEHGNQSTIFISM